MVVLRDVSCVPAENGTVPADCAPNIMDSFDVELTKKPGKGLGLSIVARKAGSGIFISDIVSTGYHIFVGESGAETRVPTRRILNINVSLLLLLFVIINFKYLFEK